jgi:hypothetical protein
LYVCMYVCICVCMYVWDQVLNLIVWGSLPYKGFDTIKF